MKIFNKKTEKVEIDCDHDEYCPIYLSYLGKYGENSEQVKYCKNPSVHYCRKYNLVDQTTWHNMSDEEKMKVVESMNLIKYLDKE